MEATLAWLALCLIGEASAGISLREEILYCFTCSPMMLVV
jgi:hypothetical protein